MQGRVERLRTILGFMSSVRRLSPSSLADLPPAVARPAYDRARVTRGIVHLGVGAFHRAHQALYTDAALAAGDLRWGIAGVSLRGTAMRDALLPQDCLYSVLERYGDAVQARVVGALQAIWHAPSALETVLNAIADPAVQVITSTVTEKGYCQHPATGALDLADGDVGHDLREPERPRTLLGVLAAGIRRRPAGAPLSVVCCDNMASNGDTVRRLLAQFVHQTDPALAPRIEADIAFPNTMVDRIVPAATAESLSWAQAQLGLRDEAAIVCEPFSQWVIEDRFAGARPEWERAGALFTSDVRPFQAMKLRLLNGSHSAIAYLGQLHGLATVADVMADPALGPFIRRLMTGDLRSAVVAPHGYDVSAYCAALLHRFENPTLRHRTEQIAMDGTQKIAVRWLPPLREALAAGRVLDHLERALAAWLHYLIEARDVNGSALVISDLGALALAARMRAAGEPLAAVQAALAHAPVFGTGSWPEAFAVRLAGHLASLRRGGVAALLARLPRIRS
jgi:fructuronate reductase